MRNRREDKDRQRRQEEMSRQMDKAINLDMFRKWAITMGAVLVISAIAAFITSSNTFGIMLSVGIGTGIVCTCLVHITTSDPKARFFSTYLPYGVIMSTLGYIIIALIFHRLIFV